MSWLKDCEICNAGLCKAVDERKTKGMREHAACAEMSKESNALYSTKQILDRYRYHTGKDKRVSEIPKEKVAKNDLVVSRRGDQLLSQPIPENHEDRKINPEHEKEGQQLLEKLENLIKPPKAHIKPETKIQLEQVATEIKAGKVSDDDVKAIVDAAADSVLTGNPNDLAEVAKSVEAAAGSCTVTYAK